MARIDDPAAWIVRLFEMETREGRGHAIAYPKVVVLPQLPLIEGERVYGSYKGQYHFTPLALFIVTANGIERLAWVECRSCSSRHGDGAVYAEVTLVDGRTIRVRVADMGRGWQGRIAQLFHQMIERHGAKAFLGRPLVTPSEFFTDTVDAYDIAPNLEPHPPLALFRDVLQRLAARADTRLFLELAPDPEEQVAVGLVIVTDLELVAIREELAPLQISIATADDAMRRHVDEANGCNIFHGRWD